MTYCFHLVCHCKTVWGRDKGEAEIKCVSFFINDKKTYMNNPFKLFFIYKSIRHKWVYKIGMHGNVAIGSGGIEMNVNSCLLVYFWSGQAKSKCTK